MRSLGFLVLCLWASTSAAQEVERGTRVEGASRYGGFGYFTLGYLGADESAVNDALGAAGFPDSPWGGLTLGGGGYFVLDRVVVGGTGSWLLAGSSERGDRAVGFSGGFGLAEVGYVVLEHEDYWLYPIVGIGGGGVTYTVASGSADTFQGALAGPYREGSVSAGGLLAEVGVGFDFFHGTEEATGAGGPIVGVRAGWMFQPSSGDWRSNVADLEGGPDLDMGGPFVRLVLGGGGFNWK